MSSIGPAGLGPVLAVMWAALLLGVAAPRTQAQEAAAAEAAAPGTPPEAAPEAASRLPMVTVATAAMRELTLRVAVSGTLVARERVQVYPQVEGAVITELLADVGDRVEEGQILVQLDDRALRSRLAQAEAERARAEAGLGQADNQIASAEATLEQAGQAFARARSLRESGTATQAALDDAQADLRTAEAGLRSAEDGAAVAAAALRQAEASLELAQLDLANAEIAAPAAGIVSARDLQVGAVASAAAGSIFTIIRDGLVEVEAQVVETELGLLSNGDPAEMDVAGLGPVTGRVRRVAPTVDPATRLGRVQVELDPREGLRPGLFSSGVVVAERRQALAVPATAVLIDAEEAYVLRVQDGVLERRPVEPGLLSGDWIEIVSGLDEEDRVVARAAAFFADGDRVRSVTEDEAAQADARADARAADAITGTDVRADAGSQP